MNYYNEIDPYASQWLMNLMLAGHIPLGIVDTRSIVDVTASDIAGFTQCHFFAGIGGWSLAARLAGWSDSRPLWTGSCPCQPFSVAGKQAGQADKRHLWPEQFRLIRACRPPVWMGEQVAAAVGKDWLDGVCTDLESIGYACGAAVVPACAVDAPHRRDRLWIVADDAGGRRQVAMLDGSSGSQADRQRETDFAGSDGARITRTVGNNNSRPQGHTGDVASRAEWAQSGRPIAATGGGSNVEHSDLPRREHRGEVHAGLGVVGEGQRTDSTAGSAGSSDWSAAEWIIGHDGKVRRVEPDVRRVVDGLSESLGRLRTDFYAEAAEKVIGYATATQCGPDEVLRAVRDAVAAQAVWQEPRGFHCVREAEILLPYLRELEGRINEGRAPGAVAEVEGQGMRGVRISTRPARAPQGWGLHEQRGGEYPDSLHALSWVLARAARQTFEAVLRDAPIVSLLASGVAARVGRLRAYGNAIVPQVAAEVIAAYMECAP